MGKLITDGNDNGGFWDITLAGFVNPRYLTHPSVLETDTTGFSIDGLAMLVISFENGFTATVVHEQTMDPLGLAGWFPVLGLITDNPASAPVSGATSGKAFVFAALGVRHRMRATALTVADMRVRINGSDQAFNVDTGTVALSGTIALAASAANIGAIVSTAAEDVAIAAATTSTFGMALQAQSAQKVSMSASGDKVNAQGTMDGRQIVKQNAIPELEWRRASSTGGIATASDTTIKAAAGAGIKNYMTAMQLANGGATATEVALRDSAAGTTIWFGHLAAGAKETIEFPTPLPSLANGIFQLAVFTAGAAIHCNAQGYTGP